MKCACKADLYSKSYPDGIGQSASPGGFWNVFKKHTKIEAEYECVAPNGKRETVTGTHTASYWTDSDDTLVAKGVEVYSRKNQLLDVIKTAKANWFNPATSDVPELQEWARKNG
ncbi:MAG: hypothetical protein VX699_13560 [Myxococcota bacterium]|nr:hypothetical protein [Myxococcota bacterium]